MLRGHLLTSPHDDSLPDFQNFFRFLSISLLLVKVEHFQKFFCFCQYLCFGGSRTLKNGHSRGHLLTSPHDVTLPDFQKFFFFCQYLCFWWK
ncbi:hypothetical protein PUN28_008764 [Cardiocondyla obscurior]|uniref:Uncharacterized protein n=1 Tax=Cardiocondyla obscurior TaxID=286306 RepID=A0AAW2FTX5_9HYME